VDGVTNNQAQALPLLRRGSTGEAVRRLQRSLVLGKLLPNTGIDGIFGPATEQAVRAFQQAVGVGVDGIVGPQTWARLPEAPALPVLRRGSTGDAVRHLQEGLTEIAKGWEADSPGAADGVVGDHTWYAQVGGVGRLLDFAKLGGD
jgi:peptidoglycan hydrolase-like protein with peptidoglycan-binding domain